MNSEINATSARMWPTDYYGNPTRPPLVLLHGSFGSAEDWRNVAELLSDSFYCVVPDLPGHGRNTERSFALPFDFETVKVEILEFLQAFAKQRPALLGYSLGGRLAIAAALSDPICCSALVVESASAGIADMEARRARAESDKLRAEQIRERGFVQFIDEWYCLPVFASLRAKPGIYQSMIERRRKEHPEWAARSLEMLSPGLQPNNSERLFALEMPALFVAGAMDLKFSILAQDMSKRVANGEFIQLDDAGHNVHLEKPFEFAKTVADFLMTRMSDCI